MGLAEKRIATTFQNEKFPAWQEKITAVAGYPVTFEIDFPSLVIEGYGDSYPQVLELSYFRPLEEGLKTICADEMGKGALKEKVKKIKITAAPDRRGASLDVKIDRDTLHLDADPTYWQEEAVVDDYAKRISLALEKAL